MREKNSIRLVSLRCISIICIIALGLATFVGCGGGGDDGQTPSPVTNQSIGGIWEGTFFSIPLSRTFITIGLASENSEVHFISNEGAQYTGIATVSGDSVSGTFNVFAPPNYLFPDGSTHGTAIINGIIIERQSLDGTYSGLGDSGNFSLTYNTLYDRDSSLSLLEGQWFLGTINGIAVNILLTIQNDGTVTGNDLDGNTYNGTFTIIDSAYNLYKVNVNITDINGHSYKYSGLTALADLSTQNDIFYFGVTYSNIASVAGRFVKQ